jgi:hypothetical protein
MLGLIVRELYFTLNIHFVEITEFVALNTPDITCNPYRAHIAKVIR